MILKLKEPLTQPSYSQSQSFFANILRRTYDHTNDRMRTPKCPKSIRIGYRILKPRTINLGLLQPKFCIRVQRGGYLVGVTTPLVFVRWGGGGGGGTHHPASKYRQQIIIKMYKILLTDIGYENQKLNARMQLSQASSNKKCSYKKPNTKITKIITIHKIYDQQTGTSKLF